jgi:hypothetical protein
MVLYFDIRQSVSGRIIILHRYEKLCCTKYIVINLMAYTVHCIYYLYLVDRMYSSLARTEVFINNCV